jgi:L-fuculose-phosphate aldolase
VREERRVKGKSVKVGLRAPPAKMRRELVDTALAMNRSGLSPGRSGNVSHRWAGGMLITPSGVAYHVMQPKDVVVVAEDGSVPSRRRKPSSEWRFHLALYALRPDVNAIVHAHSPNATALACAHRPIPAFHYMVAVAGGSDIPLVPYATFGTEDLARLVAQALQNRNACLMANHGQIAVGATLADALELAREVETLAEQYVKVLTIGRPHVLDEVEMARVLERFKSYGQKAQD